MKNLQLQIAELENIIKAFRICARGKKSSRGYKEVELNLARWLQLISQHLENGTWRWNGYHTFAVCDPKRRVIHAAPFLDRIVHHGIHQVIAPCLDMVMPRSTWACRTGLGTGGARLALSEALKRFGEKRFVVKLDVASYFASVHHRVLMAELQKVLPDRSADWLLWSLLQSHREYADKGCGIPLGNLTSQLFANFYLSSVDRELEKVTSDKVFYVRYMDDMVLVGEDKSQVLDIKEWIVSHCRDYLKLEIPLRKTVYLAADPVPFLGFTMDGTNFKLLARTRRRHARKVRKMKRQGKRSSEIEQVITCFQAFADLDCSWAVGDCRNTKL